MLPGIDGLALCRDLRRRHLATPILLLTARDAVPDRVDGLDTGADDYLVKPFAFAELTARLRALTRRPAETLGTTLQVGDVRLDPATRRVWRGETEVTLPNKQFRLLEYLLRHPGRVLTRTMIAEHVWDYDFPEMANVIDVHVRQLRQKLDDPYPGRRVQTVRGAGYRVSADSSDGGCRSAAGSPSLAPTPGG
jgi:two-component system OmpR family response regulator